MADPIMGFKRTGDTVAFDELNDLVASIKTKADKAEFALDVTSIPTNFPLQHDFGKKLALPMKDYYIQVVGIDTDGFVVSGIRAVKNTADTATLVFADASGLFSGTLIFRAIPYQV